MHVVATRGLPTSPELARDLAAVGERIAALVNAFASEHPGFELTALTADYFVRQEGAEREYLVEISLRL